MITVEILKGLPNKPPVLLLHWNPLHVPKINVKAIADTLAQATEMKVIPIPFGQPNAVSVSPKVYIANWDNPYIVTAVKKFCVDPKPGAIIPLTQPEFNAISSPHNFKAIV